MRCKETLGSNTNTGVEMLQLVVTEMCVCVCVCVFCDVTQNFWVKEKKRNDVSSYSFLLMMIQVFREHLLPDRKWN